MAGWALRGNRVDGLAPAALRGGDQVMVSRVRIREASCHACIRSSMSMLTPNAFSMRNAISGESAALPFRSEESVALRTPRIPAAFVTFKPSSSMKESYSR